jgi:hypothetical protein
VTKAGPARLLVLLVAILMTSISLFNQAHTSTVQSQTVVIGNTLSGIASRPSVSYKQMIRRVFGPYGNQAVSVARCESSLNPSASNGVRGAVGLFQILPRTWASTSHANQSASNPLANIQAAHEIFARDGYSWSEWACGP